jgi:hypothetical protein
MTLTRGLDASSLVRWDVAGAGLGLARCQRQYGQKDDAFNANLIRMHDTGSTGFVGGGYEFALPTKDANGAPLITLPDPAERARASWRYFTEGEPPRPWDLYVLDLEESPVGQDQTNAWAMSWYDEWFRIADRPPGIYLGSGYLTNRTGEGLREHGFAYLWYPRPFIAPNWDPTGDWPTSYNPPPPKDRDGNTVAWADCAWGGLPEIWQFAFGPAYDGNVTPLTSVQLKELNSMSLTKADVQVIADADIWPPPPSAKTVTNPTWALKSHIAHITEAVDYKIPATLKTLTDSVATKAEVQALTDSVAAVTREVAQLTAAVVQLTTVVQNTGVAGFEVTSQVLPLPATPG